MRSLHQITHAHIQGKHLKTYTFRTHTHLDTTPPPPSHKHTHTPPLSYTLTPPLPTQRWPVRVRKSAAPRVPTAPQQPGSDSTMATEVVEEPGTLSLHSRGEGFAGGPAIIPLGTSVEGPLEGWGGRVVTLAIRCLWDF